MKTEDKISKSFCEGYEAQYNPDMTIIAEFMGIEFKKDHTTRKYWHYQELGLASDKLCFDTSWDWLMPAIAKFRDLHYEGKQQREHRVFIDKLRTAMYWTKIDTAQYELSKAIKWHNEQPK